MKLYVIENHANGARDTIKARTAWDALDRYARNLGWEGGIDDLVRYADVSENYMPPTIPMPKGTARAGWLEARPFRDSPTMRRARFWTYAPGTSALVKLTLAPGQTITHSHFRYTDEGWNRDTARWTFPMGCNWIERSQLSEGRDCDGRMDRHCEVTAMVDKLAAIPITTGWTRDGEPIYGPERAPEWVVQKRGQRDYSAEAAGY